MEALGRLYRETILSHSRSPKNRGTMKDASFKAEGFNPMCGDQVVLMARMDTGVIGQVVFSGHGCAICTASASVLSEELVGLTVGEAKGLARRFETLLTGQEPGNDADLLPSLKAFAGVRQFPSRRRCALLAWETMVHALEGREGKATTEKGASEASTIQS
jgi:nitrogen fixation NifU-like protein